MKYNVIVWGIGSKVHEVLKNINPRSCNIIGFCDNDVTKQQSFFEGKYVLSLKEALKLSYNYIIITVRKFQILEKEAYRLGVEKEQLISYFNFSLAPSFPYREIFYCDRILYDNFADMDIRLQKLEEELHGSWFENNFLYECSDKRNSLFLPIVIDAEETVQTIINDRASVSRFGDGEFDQIFADGEVFQMPDPVMKGRLLEILKSSRSNHMVCISDFFGKLTHFDIPVRKWIRKYLSNGKREKIYSVLDKDKIYYDSYFTRPYIQFNDKEKARKKFQMIRKIWEDRETIIVEGEKTRFGVGNDLLHNAKSVERIICPSSNAFFWYPEILNEVKKHLKEKLILAVLGPTATILCYDLAGEGYQAVDIGQVDAEYEWFLKGTLKRVPLAGKYTEGYENMEVENVASESYKREIIAKVGEAVK